MPIDIGYCSGDLQQFEQLQHLTSCALPNGSCNWDRLFGVMSCLYSRVQPFNGMPFYRLR